MASNMERLTSDKETTSVFLPGWMRSAVWFLLCVYDFGCVGCMFVSGQQQFPEALSVIGRLTKA